MDLVSLGSSPILAIAARGLLPHGKRSIALADLANWPLVAREAGSRTRATLDEAAAQQGVTLRSAIEVDGREALREVVASGAGIGFMSQAELGHDPRLVSVSISGAQLAMEEALVTLRARRDVPVLRAFLRSVAEAEGLPH